jgi:electron transfer DM13
VRYSCRGGRIAFTLSPKPEGGPASVRRRCRRKGEESFIATGPIELTVQAPGRFSASVEQQVDTPLNERPLQAMRAPGADVIARGRFYSIERKSRGRAQLYRLANGRLALRFEDFKTSSNSDLFVWLSPAERPRTTKQVVAAPHREIALLKSTLGNQNYLLPRGVDQSSFRSVVIWCEPVLIAYGAASLASG